jgi:PPOX class probable F420-dependent enzyme
VRWRADPAGDRFFVLRTYRRDGRGVDTALWLAADGPRWLGLTPAGSGKVARIERGSQVRLARSDADGVPRGDWVDARARVLDEAGRRAAIAALTRRYGAAFRFFRLVLLVGRRGRGVALEVRPC